MIMKIIIMAIMANNEKEKWKEKWRREWKEENWPSSEMMMWANTQKEKWQWKS